MPFGGLQLRDIFEAVARDDAVVRVRGNGDQRRIGPAALDVVVGRIGQERLEVGFLVRMAVIVDPVAAGGELVEAQHVHHSDAGSHRVEQVGTLVGHRPDEQAAVRAAIAERPCGAEIPFAFRYSPAAMKSSNTFCLF